MVFAVTDIKIALSVSFTEIKWILCLYRMGEFSPFSFCNIFFSKFNFLHLKVLFIAKLYSSIEVIEKYPMETYKICIYLFLWTR